MNSRSSSAAFRPLLRDVTKQEASYYRRTGIFPIMHAVVIREHVLARWPEAPRVLYDLFSATKRQALQRRLGTTFLPWVDREWDRILDLFGGDPNPYGLGAQNLRVIETMGRFLLEQKLIQKPVVPEQLLPQAAIRGLPVNQKYKTQSRELEMRQLFLRGAFALCASTSVIGIDASSAAAQVTDFYRGKAVRLIVGSEAGGLYDVYGRLVAQFLPNHIPGQPSIVVENMNGASGLRVTNYMFSGAPRDGTVISTTLAGMPAAKIFSPEAASLSRINYPGWGAPLRTVMSASSGKRHTHHDP